MFARLCGRMKNGMRNTSNDDELLRDFDNLGEDASANISYEEISAWGTSFARLMESKGQRKFTVFLKSEFADENILFWQACEKLKREENWDEVKEKAGSIYEDFLAILSPKEISIDSRVREIVNSNMKKQTINTFDVAHWQIYDLMQRDFQRS